MIDLREKFTKWYYRKGYHAMRVFYPYGDGLRKIIFSCPWWVKPLLGTFFSYKIYLAETQNDLDVLLDRRLEELKGLVKDYGQSSMENTEETA